jgi:hypothetical protein
MTHHAEPIRTWRIYMTDGNYLAGHTGTEYPTRDAATNAATVLWENDTRDGWKTRGLIVADTPEYALAVLAVTHGDADHCARCYEPDSYCRCYNDDECARCLEPRDTHYTDGRCHI